MEVRLVKLISGEDFLAEVKDGGDHITCKNMMKLAMTQEGMAMVPFNPLLEPSAEITIKSEHVIFVSSFNEELSNKYREIFGGVILPPKQLQLEL